MVAGNWKMYGRRASTQALARDVSDGLPPDFAVTVAICPPVIYLEAVREALADQDRVLLAAQDVCAQIEDGARTGEISGAMLRENGARYVLVGHSERRQLLGETNECVGAKMLAALDSGLTPILCVGETLAERDGLRTEAVVAAQLQAAIHGAGVSALAHSVVAYEPVWAIGTGRNATPDQAQAVHAFIRNWAADQAGKAVADGLRILYGGSVKPDNAAALFAMPDVDGGLIGGASLVADQFLSICKAALPR
jgi:triosephosphate isomerase